MRPLNYLTLFGLPGSQLAKQLRLAAPLNYADLKT